MLPSLDMNLVRVFNDLMKHHSVSRTAEALHLSQSAVSKQLNKLRQTFNDPLFDRTPHGLKPTPRAKALHPQFRELQQLLRQITEPELFDPALCQRQFEIELLETAYPLTFPRLIPEVLQKAPGIGLNLRNWQHNSMQKVLDCEIDLGISCREFDPRSPMTMRQLPDEIESAELAREESVALVCKNHPLLIDKRWDQQGFIEYGHINLSLTGIDHWLLDDVLSAHQCQRNIKVNMSDVYSASDLCQQTHLILCMPARYAENMQAIFDLECLPIPFHMQAGSYVLVWHRHFNHDRAHAWLRQRIIAHTKAG